MSCFASVRYEHIPTGLGCKYLQITFPKLFLASCCSISLYTCGNGKHILLHYTYWGYRMRAIIVYEYSKNHHRLTPLIITEGIEADRGIRLCVRFP